jgi:N-methylhydantoinase A
VSSRFGIDIGGTFTDFIHYDEDTTTLTVRKVPTTPSDPREGCMNATRAGLSAEQLGKCDYFLHGTTVGLNALLERRGSRLALITTAGFRDVLELRRGDNVEALNLFWKPQSPLVPRSLRLEVKERMRSDGTVDAPLQEKSVREAWAALRNLELDCIAVVLLNAYANPEHELAIERILRDGGFQGEIALSHRISRECGEYERTSTTVVDAFVRKRMRTYLSSLESELTDNGFSGRAFVTRSGGGALTFGEAMDRPFETINSGPAGGAAGAARLAQELGLGTIVTADVGGTSFDTTIVTDGVPKLMFEGGIMGFPLQTSWIDVRSIGAGGGSIAYQDPSGRLRVGPRSAGAVPGPASYSLGGMEPTTTDAALVLGMLGTGQFLSGLHLDRELAVKALEPLAGRLALDVHQTARGVIEITAAAMSAAIREITLEQGEDPRTMTLLAFGGGGPLMACLLADELGISKIVVPNHAGNFSAWGLLGASMVRSSARSIVRPLNDAALEELHGIMRAEFDAIGRRSETEGVDQLLREAVIDIRFSGQRHSVPVVVAFDGARITETVEEIETKFRTQYRRHYGILLDERMEIVAVRATFTTPLAPFQDPSIDVRADLAQCETIDAYSFSEKEILPFSIVERGDLGPGTVYHGPMIINEMTTTTYVDVNYRVEIQSAGHMILVREEA